MGVIKRKDYERLPNYSFKAEDDWGDYYNGKYRNGCKHKKGYIYHWYNCTDGKRHRFLEHVVKWEYFNGKIPEGLEIDHIIPIMNGGTNKLSNLRLVTRQENLNNELTLLNMSNCHKGQMAWNKGKKWSDEIKKKISDSHEKVSIVKINSNEVIRFESLREAERLTKISHSNIKRCCEGGYFNKSKNKWINVTQAGGFKWMYLDDYEKMLEEQLILS